VTVSRDYNPCISKCMDPMGYDQLLARNVDNGFLKPTYEARFEKLRME
jgi:hypothetical protein